MRRWKTLTATVPNLQAKSNRLEPTPTDWSNLWKLLDTGFSYVHMRMGSLRPRESPVAASPILHTTTTFIADELTANPRKNSRITLPASVGNKQAGVET